MKRSRLNRGKPLDRGKPLARGAGLKRGKRINPTNPKRRAANRAKRYGPQAALCRTLPCATCGNRPAQPHHWPTVARGGEDSDTIPLCAECHVTGGSPRAFHSTPLVDWEAFHGVEIAAILEAVRTNR